MRHIANTLYGTDGIGYYKDVCKMDHAKMPRVHLYCFEAPPRGSVRAAMDPRNKFLPLADPAVNVAPTVFQVFPPGWSPYLDEKCILIMGNWLDATDNALFTTLNVVMAIDMSSELRGSVQQKKPPKGCYGYNRNISRQPETQTFPANILAAGPKFALGKIALASATFITLLEAC